MFAPPYTFFPILPPAMFTLLLELFVSLFPVGALFPPPKTLFFTLFLVPCINKFVFWDTVAFAPFPPAYRLLLSVESLTITNVFWRTLPSFPPP